MDKIVQRILDLKKEIQTPNVKLAIQRLQQSLYESKSKSKISASEKRDKNNSAKNSSIENEDIEAFLFNRYNR
jgi:NACalpha-BTF3-like transcription factor